MPSRFDINYSDRDLDWDPLIDEVFGELRSSFLELPTGEDFIEYPTFERGYQALKRCTNAFASVSTEAVLAATQEVSIALTVFRCILGFSPPEWAYLTTELTNIQVSQGAARAIDRKIRTSPNSPLETSNELTKQRILAMVQTGINALKEGGSQAPSGTLHRLAKVDTEHGIASLVSIADLGVPYPALLYERFLGRPFATHRDAVSELVGEVVESAIKNVLAEAKVSFRETRRAERIAGYDQSPDFIVPDEFAPAALIEAKLTEDDGTARDKVTRVQRLRTLRDQAKKNYDIIACIAGRGFKVRREDMRRLLQATDGKVFTLRTMHLMIDHTRISEYRSR